MTTVIRPSAAIAACVLLSLWPLAPASGRAATTARPAIAAGEPAASTFSLTISPTRLEVSPQALGDDQAVDIINGGSAPLTVTVQKRNFTGRLDGTLSFQEEAPYAASTWVELDGDTFVVPAHTTKTVKATITVPADPEPGDHQVALVFLVPAGKSEANVRINRGIAIPVYVTVPGPTDDTASVTDLAAPGFVTGGSVDLTATVHNTGTVHRDFRDKHPLTVRAPGHAEDFADFTVMRGGTRTIATTWDPPLFCICHPTVSITNADGTIATQSVRVIVLPLPMIGAVLGSLLVIILLARLGRRRYRAQVAGAAAALAAPPSALP